MGELTVALLALFAHMERVFMRERAAHAREVAQAKGKPPGRPRKLAVNQLAAARAALDAGQSIRSATGSAARTTNAAYICSALTDARF
ncbi:hypothetical protein [Streptomyces sp. ME19-01-6]|uniref:hypothetical protein n=1 Tax=Streptomyces sp. ME19-01-6 TaxID=3028686 RepID=UPI0029A88B09|nr:hypothetical protein [Streptomyces sp. ME19-01-6]MDX3225212.1 hypothetical protein [Streptomyces sp. ME19-01-6]